MREVVIVSAVRTAIGKAGKGTLSTVRPEDLGAYVVRECLERTPELFAGCIDDVIFGCAIPEAEQGLNVARMISIRAGLSPSVPAYTLNRFCASGLQAIANAAERIMCGAADVVVAGGVESMSMLPMAGHHPSPHPELVDTYPEIYMAMGHTAEFVAKKYGITREDQDVFALRSHQRAAAAQAEGKFQQEITPLELWREGQRLVFRNDEGIRKDTTLAALSQLQPVFHSQGTVTAGNASQTSDGAAAVVLMSAEQANRLGVTPLASFRSFAVAGVAPEEMGIGPVLAIPKALDLASIRQRDIGLIELNEAFAAQCLAVIRELDLNEQIVNVNGGAIALGHPLGCSGARLTVSQIYEARRRGIPYGLISMCIGGGMGAAAVFQYA